MRLIGAIALIVGCCNVALSEEGAAVSGAGTRSCAEYAADYKQNPKVADMLYLPWAQGFLSAQNIRNVLEHKSMRSIPSNDRILMGIRQACDAHPLAPFFEIVLNFFNSQPQAPQSN